MTSKSSGLVLAAGGSQRMGQPKQLLPVDGQPLLGVVLSQVCASRLDEVVVVLGGHAEEIAAAVDLGRARAIVNADYASGMSSSLKAGIAAMGDDVQRVVIVLGDQPDVSSSLIDDLLELQETSRRPAASLSFDGLLHPPVVLDRSLWSDLDELQGDVGCRALIRGRPELVAALPLVGRTGHPIDIDTLADYHKLVGDGAGVSELSQQCRAAVITVSDSRAAGGRGDESGDVIAERLRALPAAIIHRSIVADTMDEIQSTVRRAMDLADLVVLTGGTGLGPRDVTPQAVTPLLDYQVPGMSEAMRHDGSRRTPHAMLSRQVVGVAGRCLIIALPGSPKAVAESLDSIWDALPHALQLLRGDTAHRPASAGKRATV
jgi:molybdopterin adenylyltransferase